LKCHFEAGSARTHQGKRGGLPSRGLGTDDNKGREERGSAERKKEKEGRKGERTKGRDGKEVEAAQCTPTEVIKSQRL